MPTPPDETSGGPYRVARTVGGLVLIGVASVTWLIRTPDQVDTGQLLLMLGTGGVLLGVDVVKRIIH